MAHHKTIRVIVVADNNSEVKQIKNLAAKASKPGMTFELSIAYSREQCFRQLNTIKPHLAILVSDLKHDSVLEVCRIIREATDWKNYIGIILIADFESSTLMTMAMGLGADDFLTKERLEEELVLRMESVLRVTQMAHSLQTNITKLQTANKRLEKLSITDELSTLYNMRYFKKRLQQEITRSNRYQKNLSIIMFDIDNFKGVNDKCDHLMGSFIISEIGKLVSTSIRRELDFAARYGGDEFIIMMPETNSYGARVCAENLLRKISAYVFDNGIYRVQISVSLGIATMEIGSPCLGVNDLICRADHNLFAAKRKGRSCIVDQHGEKLERLIG